MTKAEIQIMSQEDEELRPIMKGHYFGVDEKRPIYDQPYFYYTKEPAEELKEDRPVLDGYWKPAGYNWAGKLTQSGHSIIPAVAAFTMWSFRMSGDISPRLANPIIYILTIAALGIFLLPWLDKK